MPTELSPGARLELVTASIDRLLALPNGTDADSQTSAFVSERIHDMESTATRRRVISVSTAPTHGFIRPETEIKPSEYVDGFLLDDPEIYGNLLREIRDIKDMPGWQAKTVRDIAPTAVLRTIAKYFGSFIGNADTGPRRQAFYSNRTTADSPPCSLQELKGTALAECIERASVAQNLLTFLGYDSTLVLSPGCELVPGSRELHAYNVVRTEKGTFIADFTNPRLVEDGDANVVNYLPSAYPISNDQFTALMQGARVTVQHSDVQLIGSEHTIQPAVPRIYAGPMSR